MADSNATCSVDGCLREPRRSGKCYPHYRTVDVPERRQCKIDGCSVRNTWHGYCDSHAYRAKAAGVLQLPEDGSSPTQRSCRHCGQALPRGAHGTRKYCSRQCAQRALRAKPEYVKSRSKTDQTVTVADGGLYECRHCGQRFDWANTRPGGSGRAPQYCSKQCRNRASKLRRPPRPARCGWCDAEYMRLYDGPQTCSEDCKSALYRYRMWGPMSEPWTPTPLPVVITPPLVEWPQVRLPRFVDVRCDGCGRHFLHDRQVTGQPMRWCSKRCAVRPGRDRRRARKRDAYVEDVIRAKVYERDRYRCHICGKRLWMSRKVPHPKAPTIDHLIPLARGGTHEMANVKAAHFACNCAKSAGFTDRGEQLLLIG